MFFGSLSAGDDDGDRRVEPSRAAAGEFGVVADALFSSLLKLVRP